MASRKDSRKTVRYSLGTSTVILECSVVVVNFNSGADLCTCLASLGKVFENRDWEAVVVDNASSDDSLDLLHPNPMVRIQRNSSNVGFAAAVNQALSLISSRNVLLINPDCEVRQGAVARLEQELMEHPECALVGPCVIDPDGTVQGSARGDPDMLTGLFGRSTFLMRLFPSSVLAKRNVRTSVANNAEGFEVDWVSGACMLARRESLMSIGGFDSDFFMYWEDADLCRRLRGLGHTIRYVPRARVMHRVGGSSSTVPELAIRSFHESAYLYYVKHVARARFHPARWFARLTLRLRMLWRLRAAKALPKPSELQDADQ